MSGAMEETGMVKKILVIDLAFIGDVILATPVMRALKAKYPSARLTMLTVPLTADVAIMDPYVDDVLVYDKRGRHRGIRGMFRIARQLKKQHFDLSVCMNFAVRGAVVSWLAGIPQRLGYAAQHAGWFLTMVQSARRDGIKHETLNHQEVLRPLGVPEETDALLVLEPPQAAMDSLAHKRERLGIPESGYIVLCPFGSYAKKNLSLAAAAHLVHHWNQRQAVYLIGGPGASAELDKIAQMAGLPLTQVLAGTLALPELAVFLQQADCLVTVDTGPMHMAEAVNCPVVAVFGPTDPVVWGPRNERDVVLYKKQDCSPCWGKGICTENTCMGAISVMEILRAADAVRKGAHEA